MKAVDAVIRTFAEMHPESAARALERLSPADAALVLVGLPAKAASQVIDRLVPYAAAAVLGHFTPEESRKLLEALGPRQAVLVLRHVEQERREAMLGALPEEAARSVRELLVCAEDTAGGMMDPQVVAVPVDVTVREAVSLLRRAPRENVHYIYVVDRERRLVGVVGMRDLLLADPKEAIEPLVHRGIVSLPAGTDREEVAAVMRQTGYLALPVVDEQAKFLGVVRHDEVLEAVQAEAFEDLQKMVGAGGDERATGSVGAAVKRRLPWLVVNLATALLASAVIALFEDVLARLTVLAVLLPIVAGQAGNTGAQTLAVVIRGLALREVARGGAWRVLIKETGAGLVNGAFIGVLTSGVIFAWQGDLQLALVIGLAMVATMTAAGLAGSAIPLALHALKRDPAQSSSIFMTTVTDVVGFSTFLGLALLLLKN